MDIEIRCGEHTFHVPVQALDAAPVLKAKILGPFSDSLANGNVVSVDRDAVIFADFINFCVQRIIPPECTDVKALLEELDFWGAGITNPVARRLRAPFEDEEKLRTDMAVFTDFLVHSAFPVDSPSTNPVYCASAVMPCSRYQFNDRWTEDVDAYKYVMGHPEMFRATLLQRWGMEAYFERQEEAYPVIHQMDELWTGSGEPILHKKVWGQWLLHGAFGVPACTPNKLISRQVMHFRFPTRPVKFSYNGLSASLNLELVSVGMDREQKYALRCVVPPTAPLVPIQICVWPLANDRVEDWQKFIKSDAEDDLKAYDVHDIWVEKGFACLHTDALVHTGTLGIYPKESFRGCDVIGIAAFTANFGHQKMTSKWDFQEVLRNQDYNRVIRLTLNLV